MGGVPPVGVVLAASTVAVSSPSSLGLASGMVGADSVGAGIVSEIVVVARSELEAVSMRDTNQPMAVNAKMKMIIRTGVITELAPQFGEPIPPA